jgi:hypothetical protein
MFAYHIKNVILKNLISIIFLTNFSSPKAPCLILHTRASEVIERD